jgi:hypothetical protein
MPGIDESRPFIPVRIAILTVSDTRELEEDKSGATLVARLESAGHILADRAIVKDDVAAIVAQLEYWIAREEVLRGVMLRRKHFIRFLKRKLKGSAPSSTKFPMPRSAPRPFNHAQRLGCLMAPICLRYPDHPGRARMGGTVFCNTNSTIAIGPAILWKLCRAWKSIAENRLRHVAHGTSLTPSP